MGVASVPGWACPGTRGPGQAHPFPSPSPQGTAGPGQSPGPSPLAGRSPGEAMAGLRPSPQGSKASLSEWGSESMNTLGEGGEKEAKNFFFNFQKNKEKISNFSFYPIQFLPLVLSFSKKSFLPFLSLSSSPLFSINAFKNTIEFCSCEKKRSFL
jgi:hypothetical protein